MNALKSALDRLTNSAGTRWGQMVELSPDEWEATIRAVKNALSRDEVLEQAAKAVEEAGYYCIPPYDETGSLPEQIDYSAAAIRAMKGGGG